MMILRPLLFTLAICSLISGLPHRSFADSVDNPLEEEIVPDAGADCFRNGGYYAANRCWDSYAHYECLTQEPAGEYVWVLGGLCWTLAHWNCDQFGLHWFNGHCYDHPQDVECAAAGLPVGCTERMVHCVALGLAPECSDSDFYQAACDLEVFHPNGLPAYECCDFFGGVWSALHNYCAHDLTEIECLNMGFPPDCAAASASPTTSPENIFIQDGDPWTSATLSPHSTMVPHHNESAEGTRSPVSSPWRETAPPTPAETAHSMY